MPDTPDPVAAALDVIRAHSDLDGPRFNPNFTCDVHVPRLLAAVEAALSRHIPDVIDMADGQFRYCSTCSGHPAWPCPEVAAIIAELAGAQLGEDGDHDRPA